MTDTTTRFALPHILPGQAQKEVFHNEALALIDAALHPAAESLGDDVPPGSPAVGQCWVVGSAPTGGWAGQADALAVWTTAGWRFVAPVVGFAAWVIADAAIARYSAGGWTVGVIEGDLLKINGLQVIGDQQAAISGPAGGANVDSEARAAIDSILTALRTHGLIAG